MVSKSKTTLKQRIIRKLENNYLFVLGWLLVGTVAIVIGTFNAGSFFFMKYNETLGNTQIQYKKIQNLSANVHISKFTEAFGNPAIINNVEKDKLKNYVYINKLFYVDVLTNLDDKVMSYAVTTRNRDFSPTITIPVTEYNGKPTQITLNKSTPADISPFIENQPMGTFPTCTAIFGVRRFWYFEGLYKGNPNNYQSVYYGINDAGIINDSDITTLAKAVGNGSTECTNVPSEFRKTAKINTFMVTAPFEFIALEASKAAQIKFGVELDEVRVIK